LRYSALNILGDAFSGQRKLKPAWRDAAPKPAYDAVVIGGGGHGLATAYYLAKEHGLHNVAVLEKSWIGSGNVGRNTTIIRSNYILPENGRFYDASLRLWERMEQDLNYNTMVSQRGFLSLIHSEPQLNAFARRGNAMRLRGQDSLLLDRTALREFVPYLNFDDARFPILAGLLQKRGGTARHDAVAWGYARAADRLGVDIIQNCEVTGFDIRGGLLAGVATSRGHIATTRAGFAVAGRSSLLAEKAGFRLPIESHVLQAFVSEAIKPLVDCVISFGAGHFYISQSDKGGLVFGGGLDGYNSYAARGNMPTVEDVCEAGMAIMPALGRLRMLRHWGGIMDMSMDGSPIIDRSPVAGLYVNAGWCYGGFKATPASGRCFAHLIARDEPHADAAAFRLDRFATGRVINERGAGAQPNLH